MKTFKLIGMALIAILMSVNFTSCSDEEVEPNFSEKVTVNFDLAGHFLDIEDTPLGRATGNYSGNNFYGIQVYTITNTGDNLPYAFGAFTSLEGVTIELIKSQKYKFEVTVVVDGAESFTPEIYGFSWTKDKYMGKFTYSTTMRLYPGETAYNAEFPFDRYYGILEEYSPTENGTVTIDTKRVSYGIKFIAENINNGYLTVEYEYYPYGGTNTVNLTSDNPTYEKIYTFGGSLQNVFYDYNAYTQTVPVTITWKQNDDDTGTPLGAYSITVKPNVKSTVKINVNSVGTSSNGISIITDETDMIEEEYTLENGELS